MSDEQEAVEEEPEVGGWQVVLSVVMTGDVGSFNENKAQEKLLTKMNLLVAEMRDLFPGQIDVATINPCIIGAQEYEV